jgi:hypothetical protein
VSTRAKILLVAAGVLLLLLCVGGWALSAMGVDSSTSGSTSCVDHVMRAQLVPAGVTATGSTTKKSKKDSSTTPIKKKKHGGLFDDHC